MDGITNISASGQVYIKAFAPDAFRQHTAAQDVPAPKIPEEPIPAQESILDIHRELAAIAPALNQRLEFSFHKELGQVVVKIIDRQTDTVIKELPPTEFQRVHVALREAIGLLIDKKV
jgi:flagellar protein FlaG